MSAQTISGWRSAFRYFDRNGDGSISAEEVNKALYSIGQKRSDAEVEQMLADIGVGKNENLNFKQFVELLKLTSSSVMEVTRTELNQLYATVDIDWSGYVTSAELKHFMSKMNIDMEDAEMAEMVSIYDLDGDGQISAVEFENIVRSFGYTITEDVSKAEKPEPSNSLKKGNSRTSPPSGASLKLDTVTGTAKELLSLFDFSGSGEVFVNDIKNAADYASTQLMTRAKDPDSDPSLHWDKQRDKRGLGQYIYKANHIAIIVRDVARSARFYSNVMGFQQIRRPNFDKHGAWFTMGNLELHLIKGVPVVHSGDDLIVGHISIETYDIAQVPKMLKKLGIPYRQNVSVPKGEDGGDKGTNDSNENDMIVRQYFFRDPDGYYIEVCNCDVLTKYCLGADNELKGYNEGVKPLSLANAALVVDLMQKWSGKACKGVQDRKSILDEVKKTDGSASSIAKLLGCKKAEEVDETILRNFITRMSIYGDICQNECEESIKEILLLAGNSAEIADEIVNIKAENSGRFVFQPPPIYEQGENYVKPPPIITDI